MISRGKIEQFGWFRQTDDEPMHLSSGIVLDVILHFIPKILLELERETEEGG